MDASGNIPIHVAIIMDGNGRWARNRGQERLRGHVQGVESVRQVIEAARKHKVRYLTLYAFSTENWGRPRAEVEGLMELLCEYTVKERESLIGNGVRVRIIGDRCAMPPRVQEHLALIEESTQECSELNVILALNYGSREEITMAVRKIAAAVARGDASPDDITTDSVANNLYTAGIPEPDLLIRTSGELRLSNFLLWQTAYTEFYFTDTLWPDFGQEEFAEALEEYARRERRYGLVTEKKSY